MRSTKSAKIGAMVAHSGTLLAVIGALVLFDCDNNERDRRAQCFGPGRIYHAGDTYQDGCNTCVCNDDGSITCTDQDCTPTCEHEGKSYQVGESFPLGDGCNLCTCMASGEVECTGVMCGKNCIYAGVEYAPGDTFPALDGCNTCDCYSDGTVGCTERACPCDPVMEWWRHYETTMASECALLDFMCPANTTRFDNTCGCGCEQASSCAKSYDCTPPNMCDVPQIQADCPYSTIVQ